MQGIILSQEFIWNLCGCLVCAVATRWGSGSQPSLAAAREQPRIKIKALEEAGVTVVESPAKIGAAMFTQFNEAWAGLTSSHSCEVRSSNPRHKLLIFLFSFVLSFLNASKRTDKK